MSHSPEPWRLINRGHDFCVAADGTQIGGISADDGMIDLDDPNWLRIVACVNACRGIPTEALNAGFVQSAWAAIRCVD
jgi:hypothetical protein